MQYRLALAALVPALATAFPWVAKQDGVDNSLWERQQPAAGAGSAATCPFNPNHEPPAPVTAQFPYNNALNGKQGDGRGGYLVPEPNDPLHQYMAPTSQDIRGPCPGLNAAANHNFIARDGITTYNELVDAVQNVYNMGYDLANFLAVFSIYIADGDFVTSKLSIGCDATSRTSVNPTLTGSQPGLDGHNKFEADTSLTRSDYFLANGDNYSFNGTLFKMMSDVSKGNFDLNNLGLYRYQRYQQSLHDNPNFFFGPLGVFTHGAASFVYELFPSGTENYTPNQRNTEIFFGAQKQSDGSYKHVPERIPANWTTRVKPYSLPDVGEQIFRMYSAYPVPFGGNAGGVFIGTNFPPFITNGTFGNGKPTHPNDFSCLLYQFLTGQIPSSLNGVITPGVNGLSKLLSAIGGTQFENLGCPFPLN